MGVGGEAEAGQAPPSAAPRSIGGSGEQSLWPGPLAALCRAVLPGPQEGGEMAEVGEWVVRVWELS